MIIFEKVDISSLINALDALSDGLKAEPKNDLERDGVIQRFEFTFELSWKIIRKCLIAMGRIDVSGSPKPILREALKENFIQDLDSWFKFLEARNIISHIYNKEEAEKVYRVAKTFPEKVSLLIQKLKLYGS